jgi:hypothetical protein
MYTRSRRHEDGYVAVLQPAEGLPVFQGDEGVGGLAVAVILEDEGVFSFRPKLASMVSRMERFMKMGAMKSTESLP